MATFFFLSVFLLDTLSVLFFILVSVLVDAFVFFGVALGVALGVNLGVGLPRFLVVVTFLGVSLIGVAVLVLCLEDLLPLPPPPLIELSPAVSSDSKECGFTYSISTLDSDPTLTIYLTSTCVTFSLEEELSLISK